MQSNEAVTSCNDQCSLDHQSMGDVYYVFVILDWSVEQNTRS
jgi:hypothetical protein